MCSSNCGLPICLQNKICCVGLAFSFGSFLSLFLVILIFMTIPHCLSCSLLMLSCVVRFSFDNCVDTDLFPLVIFVTVSDSYLYSRLSLSCVVHFSLPVEWTVLIARVLQLTISFQRIDTTDATSSYCYYQICFPALRYFALVVMTISMPEIPE